MGEGVRMHIEMFGIGSAVQCSTLIGAGTPGRMSLCLSVCLSIRRCVFVYLYVYACVCVHVCKHFLGLFDAAMASMGPMPKETLYIDLNLKPPKENPP